MLVPLSKILWVENDSVESQWPSKANHCNYSPTLVFFGTKLNPSYLKVWKKCTMPPYPDFTILSPMTLLSIIVSNKTRMWYYSSIAKPRIAIIVWKIFRRMNVIWEKFTWPNIAMVPLAWLKFFLMKRARVIVIYIRG